MLLNGVILRVEVGSEEQLASLCQQNLYAGCFVSNKHWHEY